MDNNFKNRYIEARKRVIRSDFAGLNDMQQRAVMATEGPLLVLAGAGSGKTTVLINRIANLLRYGRGSDSDELPSDACERDIDVMLSGGDRARELAALDRVEPWRILAITFTNKAAGEIKERLTKMLGDSADDIWACTFHSACVRILRRDAERLGYPSSYTIYDANDSLSVIKRVIKEMELDEKAFPPKAMLAVISNAKDSETSAQNYLASAKALGDLRRIKIGEIYSEYERRLFSAGAMDFDDLIFNTVRLLKDNADVRDYWQRRFRYVLIDEYQDTNHLQYLFASLMSGGWGNICVVGDDDQSIYKFRGATIENILSFEDEHDNCRTIRLEQNYRSTSHILNAANSVIRNNMGRKGKELWTDRGSGNIIKLYVADNEHEEAQYVASQVLAHYSHGGNWRDNAVLYRMNAQSNQIEYALKRNSIPYRIVGGTRFFDRAEIKDVLSYLNIVATPADDLRLSRIINVPARGIGEKTVDTVRELAQREGISMAEVCKKADTYPALSRSAGKLKSFYALIEELRAFAENNTCDLILDEVIEKTGYLRMLVEKNTVEDDSRADNVRELKTSVLGYMSESGDSSLQGFLENVALYTDLDNYDKDADCVVLMTMHSAKGLEFPNVYLVGMEETIFPGIRAIGETNEMEEERRLCYVAITRAMNELSLVCARQRMLYGRTTANRVSRFVNEIQDEDIERNIPPRYSYTEMPRENRYVSRPAMGFAPPPASEKPAPEMQSFELGCSVRHRAFGSGVIVKLTPMGGDYLAEINFESVGTKKLMLRAAAQFMVRE